MSTLNLATGLELPVDSVTRTFGVVGQRGTGKTSTAVALVEELAPHAPFVVIDPTGAWYGLASSKSGKGPGVDCVVLGGHHGEIPLEDTAGQLVADLIVRDRYSLVLDLELMRKGRQIRFVADFLEALYHASREATHVVIDEAQRFAPQNSRSMGGDLPRCTGAVEDVVKLGRRKGLGCTFISQRPASIAKDVLEQAETIIVHRVTGPRDRKAIAEWFEAQGEPEDEKAALAALPKLKRGQAYVMSPAFLEVFGMFPIRRRRTFDSSREPEPGETASTPTKKADVDLGALRERMAETIERVKAEDPKALRAEVAKWKGLAERHKGDLVATEAEVEELRDQLEAEQGKTHEVPAFSDDDRALLERVGDVMAELGEDLRDGGPLHTVLLGAQDAADPEPPPAPRPKPAPVHHAPPTAQPNIAQQIAHDAAMANGDVELTPSALRVLEAAARRYPAPVTKSQLATLAGMAVKGGAFIGHLSALKKAGALIEEGRDLVVSSAGFERLGLTEPPPPQSPAELLDMWRGSLKPSEAGLLDVLVEHYPEPMTKEGLALVAGQRAGKLDGYAVKGGAFIGNLSTLKKNGLAEVNGSGVRASSTLFG